MKFIQDYQIFLEALLPSQIRRYMKVFDRERYSEIFNKYDGDKNHYRIYLPLVAKPTFENDEDEDNDSPKALISDFLSEHDYEVTDYIKGTCQFNGAKNPSKIGQVLTRLEREHPEAKDLMKSFVEDPIRKAGSVEELIAVISRHPYDIAGADTDRAWTNCMTMGHAGSNKVGELQAKLDKLKERKKRIAIESNNIELMVDELDNADENGNGEELIDDLGYTDEQIEDMKTKVKELEREEEKIDNQIEELEENIDDRLSTGENAKYLIYDVKEGSLSAFLVKKSDLNIKNPLCTLNIKPYINEDDEDDFILASDNSMYGQTVPEFKQTVDAWLRDVNGADKEGIFCLNDKLYDDGSSRIELMSKEKAIKKIINTGTVNDIIQALRKRHIDISDVKSILDAFKKDSEYEEFEEDLYDTYSGLGNDYNGVKTIFKDYISQDKLELADAESGFSGLYDGDGLLKLLKRKPEYIKYLTYGGIFKPKKDNDDRYNDYKSVDLNKIFGGGEDTWEDISSDFVLVAKHNIFEDNYSDGIFAVELNEREAEQLKELGIRSFKKQAKISKEEEKEKKDKKEKKAKKIKESIVSFRDFK